MHLLSDPHYAHEGVWIQRSQLNFTKVTQLFCSRSRNWKGGLLTHSPQVEKVAHWESLPRTIWPPGVKGRSYGCKSSSATKVPHILGKFSPPRRGADVAHRAECGSLSDHTRDEGPAICQLLGIPGWHTKGRARSQEPQRSRAEKRLGNHNGLNKPLSGLPVLFFLSPSFFCLTSSVLCPFLSLLFHAFGFLGPFRCSSLPRFLYFLPPSCLLACSLSCSLLPVFLSLSSKPRPRLCQGSAPLPHTSELGEVCRELWSTLWRMHAQTGVIPVHGEHLAQICLWSSQCLKSLHWSPHSRDQALPEVRTVVWENQLTCSVPLFLNKLCDLGKVT